MGHPRQGPRALIKRCTDVAISAAGLLTLAPFMSLIALLVKLTSQGPALYAGVRAGQFGKPFRLLKFRTMVVNAERIGGPSTSDDDPRVTPMGRFLRKYKLDELPQLINVLSGEMSLVGPRPEVLSEVALYTPEERQLLTVKPGVTDWASLHFHNEGEILKGATDPHRAYRELIRPEKIRLGLKYVRSRSLSVDIEILLMTIRTLFDTRIRASAALPSGNKSEDKRECVARK